MNCLWKWKFMKLKIKNHFKLIFFVFKFFVKEKTIIRNLLDSFTVRQNITKTNYLFSIDKWTTATIQWHTFIEFHSKFHSWSVHCKKKSFIFLHRNSNDMFAAWSNKIHVIKIILNKMTKIYLLNENKKRILNDWIE